MFQVNMAYARWSTIIRLRAPIVKTWRGSLLVSCARNYGQRQESKPWKQKPNRQPRLTVILTEDVRNLGLKGQPVKVKHGYGRNYLLPRKKAVYATPDNIKLYCSEEGLTQFDHDKLIVKPSDTNKKGRAGVSHVHFITSFLSDKVLTIRKDPESRWAVFEQDVCAEFRKQLQLHVPLDCIELRDGPLVTFSEHSVNVNLDKSTVVTVPVHIVHWRKVLRKTEPTPPQ